MTESSHKDRVGPDTPEFLKDIAAGKKVEFELAPQDQVEKYGPEVAEILENLGYPGALVTDESIVGDFVESFCDGENNAEDDALLEECRCRWRLETVEYEDYVWQVAARIRNKRESR